MSRETAIDSAVSQLFDGIQFTEKPEGLYDPLRYTIAVGGKRLRPRLCLTTYSLYKDNFGESILQPAAGLEVFHSFTLIHDDIMDSSPLRRGVDTVWKKWDENTAILSGDVMCIDSYRRIAQAPAERLPQVLDLFTKTAAEVCEGQQYDMDFENEKFIPMDSYIKMIGLKTGVLIGCSAKMGALIAGASDQDCNDLYLYGYNLGLAFQIADDYLDAFGNEKIFGKPIGGDIVNNKKSWLTTRAVEKADDNLKDNIFRIMEMPAATEEEKKAKINEMKAVYAGLSIEEEAKREILRLNNIALEYASRAVSGEKYEILEKFADKLIGRSK